MSQVYYRISFAALMFGFGCLPYDPDLSEGEARFGVPAYLSVQPAPEGLGAALGSALDRWARATCLPLSVGTDGATKVKWESPEKMGKRSGVTIWNAGNAKTTIKVVKPMQTVWAAAVLTHEFFHALSRRGDEAHTSYGVASSTLSNPDALITADAIEVVCEVQNCGCFNPED